MANKLHLVGSVPFDTAQEVFEVFGSSLGKYLFSIPDGEVGPRRHWISRIHYQVLAGHPDLEVVQRPAPDQNGVERQFPRDAPQRLATARKHLANFGLGAYCGFGRLSPSALPAILEDHQHAVETNR